MIFHSYDYIVFFVLVFWTYWLLPRRGQNFMLLVASYVFYGYVHPWFLYLMAFSTLLDYVAGLCIARYQNHKKSWMIVSLVGNLGLLAVYKYFDFFASNMNAVLGSCGLGLQLPLLHIFLPVGISFYTFQTLSYTIDIYRGLISPRRNVIDFAAFVSFFPQLVAGPIERAKNLLPQFERDRRFSFDWALLGIRLMIWGYFKKLVIADNVGVYADKVFSLTDPSFLMLWAGAFAFTIQLYADFSAYSDIAAGSARLLGFKLMRNFNHPYISRSVGEFWQRWHISLTSWLRDYVLLSLHHSKFFKPYRRFNILLTFLVCGIWHGANWNFVLWGLSSGMSVILYPYVDRAVHSIFKKEPIVSCVNWTCMVFVINFHMLLFREHDVRMLFKHLTLNPFANSPAQICAAWEIAALTFIFSLPLWLHPLYSHWVKRLPDKPVVDWGKFTFETVAALVMFLGILLLRCLNPSDFVYFQF